MSLKNILLNAFHQRKKFLNATATVIRLNYDKWNRNKQTWQNRNNKIIVAALFTSGIVLKTIKDDLEKDILKNISNEKDAGSGGNDDFEAGEKRPDLPVYRAEEVNKHDTVDSFWVTYRHGVYDVTKFLPSHPGGNQILNAGGLSIEPFWNVYGMHKTKPIYQLLESYRIGNLHDDDVVEMSGNDLWVSEPVRDKRLIIKSKQPFNAEIPAKLIVESLDTPNELFFVRHHMPVPELEAKDHKLEIIVKNGSTSTKVFDLEQLEKMFPRGEVRAALMCAGNRRTEMSKVKGVKGLEWQQGAVSCARWSGVWLRDVLLHCGVDPAHAHGLHVIFTGADMDATGTNFNTSIPMEQALNPNGRIVLATHMNGEILPKDHGYPLRVIVPGAPAVRSVKWLQSITISKDESPSFWHQRDYRSFNASKTWETADFASAPPVYSLPVNSAICDPADGDTCVVRGGCIEVRGYAYSGGGARVVRVDVSADGGATWHQAQELLADPAPPPRHFSWTLWTACVPVPDDVTQVELWAKATDNNFNTQPEKFEDIWNIRGILGNAYHKIKVKLNPGIGAKCGGTTPTGAASGGTTPSSATPHVQRLSLSPWDFNVDGPTS